MKDDDPAASDERIRFLVIASDCAEARLAAFFAARRANHSGARLVLLHVIEPPEFGHWAAVGDAMRAEAWEQAETLLAEFSKIAAEETGDAPLPVIREGRQVDEIRTLIEQDRRIAILFLGAAADAERPGPLVSALAHRPAYLGARPIPVTVVPGTLTRNELRDLS